MNDMIVILGILFLSFSLILWAMFMATAKGWERYEAAFTEHTATSMEKLFLFADARKVFLVNVLMVAIIPLMILVIFDAPFYAVIALLIILFLPRLVLSHMDRKRRHQINEALPDSLAQIAGAMKAGSTLPSAIQIMVAETKGPISQEFGLVLKEQRMGMGLEDALDSMAERVQSEDMDLVVSAALIARDVGGNLAEIFLALSQTLRRKIDMEGKIRALTAQGKLQGWVVGLLPFGIILGLMLVNPEGIRPIFSGLLGWIFLAIILVAEAIGGLMIRKIVTIDI
jgi:tight adherence protein B